MNPDQDKFISQLYQEYFGKLTIYAAASLKSQNKAQDVVQDTFHEAITHIDILMQHPNPAGWLMVTLKNKIKEYQRETQKYLRWFLSLNSDLLVEPGQHDPRIEQQMDMDEPSVHKQIKQLLTTEEYLLLKRLTLDRASHLEVAQEFGISVYASQKRLERIRKKLRKTFPID